MEQKIDELIDLIKNTEQYQNFTASSSLLESPEVQALLKELQGKIARINELKKYGNYVDLSALEQELKNTRLLVSQNGIVQAYYRDYYALNELLDELTRIIFKDISPEIIHNNLNFRSK
ncbi:MAG: YlbF family regulator [Erysipelotrichaceae bacterium]|nr:YlbF family regulator [Erysipelotrichaceae bacterium]MDD3810313.1 YlbF family regulator [Erysipelotrichaceae bacterium]